MCQINLIYQKSGEQMHKENPQRSYDDYGAKYQKTAAPELERLLLENRQEYEEGWGK